MVIRFDKIWWDLTPLWGIDNAFCWWFLMLTADEEKGTISIHNQPVVVVDDSTLKRVVSWKMLIILRWYSYHSWTASQKFYPRAMSLWPQLCRQLQQPLNKFQQVGSHGTPWDPMGPGFQCRARSLIWQGQLQHYCCRWEPPGSKTQKVNSRELPRLDTLMLQLCCRSWARQGTASLGKLPCSGSVNMLYPATKCV